MSTVTLQNAAASETYVFKTISVKNKEEIWQEASCSLSEPETLRVSHQVAKDDSGVDRHLIQVTVTADDADGNPFTGSVHSVIALPREGVTEAVLQNRYEALSQYIISNFADICKGFNPSD